MRKLAFEPPVPEVLADGTFRIQMDGCRPDDIPGRPSLPIFGLSLELPAGCSVDSVTVNRISPRPIPLESPVACAQPFFKPGDPPATVNPDPLIYSADLQYPADDRLSLRTDETDGKTLLSISFSPLLYNPAAGILYYSAEISLTVSLAPSEQKPVIPSRLTTLSVSPLDPAQHCDYLIISTSNLISRATPPWDFNTLLARREYSGLVSRILPVEWIYDHYAGSDRQQQIRSFLQDAHAIWGTRYLLIAGTHTLIPTRSLHIVVSAIFEDYVEDIPSDAIYYGCMTGTFDGNGNGLYGEYNDGDGGGDVDLTAEILVGRFPVENEVELARMIRKTLRYDLAARGDFSANGFVSEKVDFGAVVYGQPFMEEIRNGSTTYGRKTLGFTNSPYAADFITNSNLHDSAEHLFTRGEILDYFSENRHSVNHIGHGSTYQCFKLNVLQSADRAALAALDNPFPYAIYSQACLSGAFDKNNCFAETFVTVSNGPAVVVMNSRNGWASTSGVYGHSHYFHRHFWDSAFRGNAVTFGEMSEASRRANLASVPSYGGSLWRWVYYELNLFGDPALPVIPALLNVRPDLRHEPLANTFNTLSSHTVSCEINPAGIYDPETPFVIWSSSADSLTLTQKMSRTAGSGYELPIPSQPLYSRIDYSICASNRAGYASSLPAEGMHTFYITDELSLLIAGSPCNAGLCDPSYGMHSSASGLVINASCTDVFYDTADMRHLCDGFIGTGSVPAHSTNHTVSFRIDTDSILIWRWIKQYRILLNSTIGIPAERQFWVDSGSEFAPPAADSFITDTHSNLFAFANWTLNGSRSPALPLKSLPLHPPVNISAPGVFSAHYIPAGRDDDSNGIADWYEYRYFGKIGNDIYADSDNDGYDLYEEFADHSDPLDAGTVPAPPAITHTPLDSTISRPGPFAISSVITDTHDVASAAILWRINGGTWQSTPLIPQTNALFLASIAPSARAGDLLTYRITAQDPSGNTATTIDFSAFLSYPVADYSLLEEIRVVVKPDVISVTNSSFLLNRGNAPLNWSLSFGLEEQVTSPALSELFNWDTSSIEQSWAVSTNRTASPPYALHGALVSTAGTPHYASITLPPLKIGTDASLRFSYWMDGETYARVDPSRAFDGGIVEYSTDGGMTFSQLKGPYTHTIYGWTMSPWPDQTPCFSGQSFGWTPAVFDLVKNYPETAGFEGQTVIFRFNYGGDDNTDREGWYIDDIRVSPAALPDGFSYTLPSTSAYTVAPGGYSELFWRNLPQNLGCRSAATTVFFDSNAPVNPGGSFNWQVLVREAPVIDAFSAAQITNGNGTVGVSLTAHDADDEPLDLRIEWSDTRGHTWHPAPLAGITWKPASPSLPQNAPDGEINAIPGEVNGTAITNSMNAVWNSTAPDTDIGWCSNLYMRLTASSPWFSSVQTVVFPVDNTPPVFSPGSVTAEPKSALGKYLVTADSIMLGWPAAVDTPPENALIYRIYSATNLIIVCTNITQAIHALPHVNDSEHTFAVIPSDPLGNCGEPLELTILILHTVSDYDSDGASNGNEEMAGTDATDPLSLFAVSAFHAAADSTLNLHWTSVTNRHYTVQTTGTLFPADWSAIPGLIAIPGSGGIMGAELPMTTSNAFFRVLAHE